jgi:hypothetical protein
MALRQFRDEKDYRSLSHYIPVAIVEQGILPHEWTTAGAVPYSSMKNFLKTLKISPDDPKGQRKTHQSKNDRRQGKPEERTSMVKVAQVHHLYHDQQEPCDVRRLLPESRQGPAVDAYVTMNTERIASRIHSNVSMMVSECGLAIVM